MSSYTGIAAFINIAIMVYKDAIVMRLSQNRKSWGGRGLESGRPRFVLPWEKIDDQCHADDDLGLPHPGSSSAPKLLPQGNKLGSVDLDITTGVS